MQRQGRCQERVAGPNLTCGGFWTGDRSKAWGGRPGQRLPGVLGRNEESPSRVAAGLVRACGGLQRHTWPS